MRDERHLDLAITLAVLIGFAGLTLAALPDLLKLIPCLFPHRF